MLATQFFVCLWESHCVVLTGLELPLKTMLALNLCSILLPLPASGVLGWVSHRALCALITTSKHSLTVFFFRHLRQLAFEINTWNLVHTMFRQSLWFFFVVIIFKSRLSFRLKFSRKSNNVQILISVFSLLSILSWYSNIRFSFTKN